MQETIKLGVTGHVRIIDDKGNVLVDQHNDIHPQNMARIIARALANEENSSIYRIAYGNGGTIVDAAYNITYKPPNTGQDSTVAQTFDTRLHNETYSEIVDESLATLGTDPGSADSSGQRPGGGAVPAGDTATGSVVSGELGLTSTVTITSILNPSEPLDQDGGGLVTNTQDAFVFDEMGLYTSGAPAVASSGTIDIDVGSKISEDDSGLVPGQQYTFNYAVDGAASQTVIFTVPLVNPIFTYGALCELLNTTSLVGAKALITDRTTDYPSIAGAVTSGRLRFVSDSTGTTSSVVVTAGITDDMIISLSSTSGNATISSPVFGKDAGTSETQERLLTHIIFAPILKSPNRTLTINYTLTIGVNPTAV